MAVLLSACFGSLTRKDLLGDWEANNRDSLYFTADTLELFQDINYSYGLGTCDMIRWKVMEKEFRLQHHYLCSEPGRVRYNTIPEKLLIKRGIGKTFLKIKWQGKTIDRFEVISYAEKEIERYPHDIKILKVKRIKD
ncbi:MAG: hypothetical protein OHK0019_03010 [Saprospiraceae bacterium]